MNLIMSTLYIILLTKALLDDETSPHQSEPRLDFSFVVWKSKLSCLQFFHFLVHLALNFIDNYFIILKFIQNLSDIVEYDCFILDSNISCRYAL